MPPKDFFFDSAKGFSSLLLILFIALIVSGGATFLFLKSTTKQSSYPSYSKQNDNIKLKEPQSEANPNEPPLKLKNIGINLDYYDPKTNKAGDFLFTKQKLEFSSLFMGYGFFIPGSSASPDKKNPQPTFVLPLGTPVRSLVDGVVASMPTLWSGDISIQVTPSGKLERWVYEIEHVINPKVKVGDKVTAGQIIAEVSDFYKGAPEGFGAVEIGILHGDGEGVPEHVCPFAYLDDSIKEDIFRKLTAFYKSWEDYIGDPTLYDEKSEISPGCLTLDPIEG